MGNDQKSLSEIASGASDSLEAKKAALMEKRLDIIQNTIEPMVVDHLRSDDDLFDINGGDISYSPYLGEIGAASLYVVDTLFADEYEIEAPKDQEELEELEKLFSDNEDLLKSGTHPELKNTINIAINEFISLEYILMRKCDSVDDAINYYEEILSALWEYESDSIIRLRGFREEDLKTLEQKMRENNTLNPLYKDVGIKNVARAGFISLQKKFYDAMHSHHNLRIPSNQQEFSSLGDKDFQTVDAVKAHVKIYYEELKNLTNSVPLADKNTNIWQEFLSLIKTQENKTLQ